MCLHPEALKLAELAQWVERVQVQYWKMLSIQIGQSNL